MDGSIVGTCEGCIVGEYVGTKLGVVLGKFVGTIDGFNDGRTYYFEDDTKGTVYLFYFDDAGSKIVKEPNFGTVDYTNGEVMLGYTTPIIFVNTVELNNLIKIRANPFAQDIVAKKSVYLDLDVDSSRIDAVIDTNVQSS